MLFDPDWVNSNFIAWLVWKLNKGYFQALLRLWLYISGETTSGLCRLLHNTTLTCLPWPLSLQVLANLVNSNDWSLPGPGNLVCSVEQGPGCEGKLTLKVHWGWNGCAYLSHIKMVCYLWQLGLAREKNLYVWSYVFLYTGQINSYICACICHLKPYPSLECTSHMTHIVLELSTMASPRGEANTVHTERPLGGQWLH